MGPALWDQRRGICITFLQRDDIALVAQYLCEDSFFVVEPVTRPDL